jgi:glycosyltransferase involved in cell wall biosynthesis
MEFSCDILIPTFNRKKFETLITHNIKIQTYPLIVNIIIADDGNDEPLYLPLPYNILYYRVPRMTIGEKRNFLLEKAKSRYIVFMDTDDMYHDDYISESIYNLLDTGKAISGTSAMNMYYNEAFYNLNCIYLHALNEATIVIDTSLVKFRFDARQTSEGLESLKKVIGLIVETDINKIMCCLAHGDNTVDKQIWVHEKYKTQLVGYTEHLLILSSINI